MKYKDFLSKFVGKKVSVSHTDGPNIWFIFNIVSSKATVLEVEEDYVVVDEGDGNKAFYPLSMVSIQFKENR
jgi:hypothetical protein